MYLDAWRLTISLFTYSTVIGNDGVYPRYLGSDFCFHGNVPSLSGGVALLRKLTASEIIA